MAFDRQVLKACKTIASTTDLADHDFRPRIKDLNTGLYMLIDTGAAVSVFPRTLSKNSTLDVKTGLQAINGTKIPTYGTQSVKIRLDRKTFTHTMVVGQVSCAILGWDFLSKFRLDLIWTNGECVLFNPKSKSTYKLHLGKVPRDNLNLAPIRDMSFAQHSAQQKEKPVAKPFPSRYQELLARYPEILECKFLDEPLHGVIHNIETT